VFGPAAVAVSPRVGHLHVLVDDLPWVWADASGVPVIIQNLLPGPHRVLVELADANHHILDHGLIEFMVPDVGQQSRSAHVSGHRSPEPTVVDGWLPRSWRARCHSAGGRQSRE